MTSILTLTTRALNDFSAESRMVGLGRTLIATAQISILALTPADYLFVPVGSREVVVDCAGLPQRLSAYCLTDGSHRQLISWLLLCLLVVVASGFMPRVTSVLHLWVSLSIHSSISLPDGGDAVAQVGTFFLVLVCLNDRRTWHWQTPERRAASSPLHGVAWAGLWGLRLQLAYVYLNSAIAKLPVGPWQEGTATYYVARMENFGSAGLGADVVLWLTSSSLMALVTTWGSIAVEATIAVLLVSRGVRHPVALALSVTLHAMIVVQLGIASFGLIMMGVAVCATSHGTEALVTRLRARRGERPGSAVGRLPALRLLRRPGA